MKVFKIFFAGLLCLFFASAVMAQKNDGVAAVVGTKKIYMSEVNTILENVMRQNGISEGQIDINSPQLDKVRKSIVENLVNRELLLLASSQNKPENLDELVKTEIADIKSQFETEEQYQQALQQNQMDEKKLTEQLKKNILLDEYVNNIQQGITVSESEKKAYYENNKSNFHQEEQVKVSHIIILTGENANYDNPEEKINEIYEKIKKGVPFSELAKEYSEDGSAQNGGNLGYIKRGATVASFEDVAFSTKVGKVSKPFKSEFGYHILKVEDKKDEKQLSFDEVENEVEQLLVDEKAKNKLNEKLQELKQKYDVQINI